VYVCWQTHISFIIIRYPTREADIPKCYAPIHQKNSVLEKGNCRPVSVLPAISKFFENAIEAELVNYFENIFNPFLAAS
jgi:hypothetical protein